MVTNRGQCESEPLLSCDPPPSPRGGHCEHPALCALAERREELEQQDMAEVREREPLGAWMARYVAGLPDSFPELIPAGGSAMLESPGLEPLSRGELCTHLREIEQSSAFQAISGSRVAVCVQNGPFIATALLAIMGRGCCCPMDANGTEAELARDCELLGAQAMVVDSRTGPGVAAAQRLGLACVQIAPDLSVAGLFEAHLLLSGASRWRRSPSPSTVLILPTSGTSGQKKAVPYTRETLIVSAACIIASWRLKPSDVCLSMMPLTHVGGILRNLIATLLSGGRILCWSCFDPVAFWPALDRYGVTWYYATPTMHRSILQEGGQHTGSSAARLRMVCNAGGGLPPALHLELRDRFRCPVLAAYGMSECMPISSPPVDFHDTVPTNGPPCGPSVSIVNERGLPLPAGEVGSIAVRGPPVMPGYENAAHDEGVWSNGWFLTGDLGYLSEAGWLRVTGRAKEVIKRGGETLAPMEIEEAVRTLDDVVEVAAFAISDSVLGENVALALVLRPGPRVGLPRLRNLLADSLRPALLPQALIYFRALPKTATGKVRRAWISQACRHLTISQDAPWRERVFEARIASAVPQSSEEIQVFPLEFDGSEADKAIQASSPTARTVRCQDGTCNTYVGTEVSIPAARELVAHLDDFLRPDAVVLVSDQLDARDSDLPRPRPDDFLDLRDYEAPQTPWEIGVCRVWSSVLGCDEGALSAASDFFEVGGTSLLAGRVASKLQELFRVPLPTHAIFAKRKLRDLAAAIEEQSQSDSQTSARVRAELSQESLDDSSNESDTDERMVLISQRRSSTELRVVLVQLLPIMMLPPFEALLKYMSFQFVLAHGEAIEGLITTVYAPPEFVVDCVTFALAVAVFPLVRELIMPLFAILVKWVLLGRVLAGRYPIWGQTYVRWWIARKTMFYCGHGLIQKRLHLKLLGASVSAKANITGNAHNLNTGHFVEGEMLTVEDDVSIDGLMAKCIALHSDCLLITPVVVKRRASVAFRTVLAPGAVIPEGASLGPWSSSHELGDSRDVFRRLNRAAFPEPHWLLQWLLGSPLLLFRTLLVNLPWIVIVFPRDSDCLEGLRDSNGFWLDRAACYPSKGQLYWWVLSLSLNATLRPLLAVGFTVPLKWLIVGRLAVGPRTNSEWEKFCYWFMDRLVPHKMVKNFVSVVGAHYKPVTWFYRLMGAKVGERIFWPGVPLDVRHFDLLHVGDDVVFGSRSCVMCVDSQTALEVKIGSSAMVADNCMLLPGTVVGQNAVLGTGSVSSGEYAANSVSIGNHEGSAVHLLTGAPQQDTMRPFGRAVYEGKATYCVMGWFSIMCSNVVSKVLSAPFESLKGWSTFFILHMLRESHGSLENAWPVICVLLVVYHLFLLCLHFSIDIGAKWALLGRRQPGAYPYDESPYCQRWVLYKTKAAMSGETLTLLGGSWWIVLYYRLLGASIGRDVCLYPWGASPSMTEPDLVSLDNNVNVEDAALVCHTNVFGRLQLSPIHVQDGCTIRDFCRVMGGGTMRKNATLLEHSLVMSGETVPTGAVWQGWPNRSQSGEDL